MQSISGVVFRIWKKIKFLRYGRNYCHRNFGNFGHFDGRNFCHVAIFFPYPEYKSGYALHSSFFRIREMFTGHCYHNIHEVPLYMALAHPLSIAHKSTTHEMNHQILGYLHNFLDCKYHTYLLT